MHLINDINLLREIDEENKYYYNKEIKYIENMLGQMTHISYELYNCTKKIDRKTKKDSVYTIIDKVKNMPNITISAIIIARNEEYLIERCIRSIEKCDFDEVIIIDTGSTDETVNIVKRLVAKNQNLKFHITKWNNNFSEIRNLGIELAKSQWVFFIDADEYYLKNNKYSIKEIISFYSIYNEGNLGICPTIINSTKHKLYNNPRIFRKDSGYLYYGNVHEMLRKKESEYRFIPNIGVNITLEHDGYKEEIYIKKDKINRNINLLNMNIEEEPYNPLWRCYLVRDGFRNLNQDILVENCNIAIDLSKNKEEYFYKYNYFWATSLLLDFYIQNKNLKEARNLLNIIKNNDLELDLTDIYYRENLIDIMNIEYKLEEKLKSIKRFREKNLVTNGSLLNTEGLHIDELIMRLHYLNHNMYEFYEYKRALVESGYLKQ